MAVGDLVKSTLGPKGMDKILWGMGRNEGQVEVTNDGATILRSIGVDNPAAKILVDMSKVQDDEVGDGTTSVVVFASELLKEVSHLTNIYCFFLSYQNLRLVEDKYIILTSFFNNRQRN